MSLLCHSRISSRVIKWKFPGGHFSVQGEEGNPYGSPSAQSEEGIEREREICRDIGSPVGKAAVVKMKDPPRLKL